MALSESERAELAVELIASLDGPAEANVDPLWLAEAVRRAEDVDAGRTELVGWEQARSAIRAKLGIR